MRPRSWIVVASPGLRTSIVAKLYTPSRRHVHQVGAVHLHDVQQDIALTAGAGPHLPEEPAQHLDGRALERADIINGYSSVEEFI